MKVTAFDKYTGEKIYELELKERRVEHIADVSRSVRLGECCYTFCPQFDDQEAR